MNKNILHFFFIVERSQLENWSINLKIIKIHERVDSFNKVKKIDFLKIVSVITILIKYSTIL